MATTVAGSAYGVAKKATCGRARAGAGRRPPAGPSGGAAWGDAGEKPARRPEARPGVTFDVVSGLIPTPRLRINPDEPTGLRRTGA